MSQVIPLCNYTSGVVPPDMPGFPEAHNFFVGMEQVYSDIASNPDARPAYWGENAAGTNKYRLYLDDNGMLVCQWTIDWGDGSPPQKVSPAPWIIHQYSTAGNYTVSVTALSPDGTFTASGDDPPICSTAPVLRVGNPQNVAAGQILSLDNLASFSSLDAPVVTSGITNDFSYSIDWGDGSVPFVGINVDVISSGGSGSPFMGALRSDTPDGSLAHAYADPGTYYVAVTVTNNASGLSDTQTIPVTVLQLAPTINTGLPPGNTCDEGTTVNLSATVAADASLTDPVAYRWQIMDSWGDIVAQGTDPALSYTFTAADTYTVLLAASVDSVQSAPVTATITVNNVAPTFVSTVSDTTVGVGQTCTFSNLAFTDPNPDDAHTVTVDWGDGTPLDTSAQLVEETSDGTTTTPGTIGSSHVYTTPTAPGVPNTVTVTLTDSNGLSTQTTFHVTVLSSNVALTDFAASSGGSQLQVTYTITNTNAASFKILIYSSSDGTTPDQLLMSHAVTNSGDLTGSAGGTSHTVSFQPIFDEIQSNYHLIAVSDASTDATMNTVEFDGGVFAASSATQTPPQTVVYVFGTRYNGTGTRPTDSVTIDNESGTNHVHFNAADYPDTGGYPVHFRAEGGNDTVTGTPAGDAAATVPLWLFGGSGSNTFTGGANDDVIVGGTGQNVIHSSNGIDDPETVDDSDAAVAGLENYFASTGSWTSQTAAGAFNGGQLDHSASTGGDAATWRFANLDPTAYYEAYVTWNAAADASTGAVYSVSSDGGATWQPLAGVNQTHGPADAHALGVFWHDLGNYQAASGTLLIRLGTDSSGKVLADAVGLVPASAPSATNLTMNSFATDGDGNFTVDYTITGEDSPAFSIGIYGSADGSQPTSLLQSYEIDDSTLLTGGGKSHRVSFAADLSDACTNPYLIAVLDCNGEVRETTKADNRSAALGGAFQNGDGGLSVFTGDADQNVAFSQDPSSGTVTATINGTDQQFTDITAISVSAGGGNVTIDASGVSVPFTAHAGSGNDTIIGGSGNNEIYGGSGTDVLDGSNGQNNWIQAGSGNATITGGSGNDWLYGGSGTNTIVGGNGTEKIYGGSGTNWLTGGTGLDDIFGGNGTNFIYGNGSHDRLTGGSGGNYIEPDGDYATYPYPDFASLEAKDHNDAATFDGNVDSTGATYQGDYQAVAPGYGGSWTFGSLDSGERLGDSASKTPVAVYAEWRPDGTDYTTKGGLPYTGTHWAHDAVYNVYDETGLLGSVLVDQSSSPGNDSPTPNDRAFKLLGVWNAQGYIYVTLACQDELQDRTDLAVLCRGDVMVHAIWPTVSIRADLDGTGTFGEKDDFLAACNAVAIPTEGEGYARIAFQVQASVETLYASISGASMADWKAILPAFPGIEFWNAISDGSQLGSADGVGNIVDDFVPASGRYSKVVWGSVDPDAVESVDPGFTLDSAADPPYPIYFTAINVAPLLAAVAVSADVREGTPFMTDWDYDTALKGLSANNPPDPAGTPDSQKAVTIAVIVETEKGELIGHSAIAISDPGVGFAPEKMEFYDFGPLGNKSHSGKPVVQGSPWWDNGARGYANGQGTGQKVPNAKLSDILRDLPKLSGGSDTYMFVTQVTAAQGANIEAYWNKSIYRGPRKGWWNQNPDFAGMPSYTFNNSFGTYNCTSTTLNSLLAASKGGAGSVLGLPILRQIAKWTKTQTCNPSMFLNLLQGTGLFLKGSGLQRTAGPNAGKPVDEWLWTSLNKDGTRRPTQRWMVIPPNR